ncbi:MAG: hypothetical protein U9N76_00880 [Candidatus Marinimicrobia bacterium]|nr:hypothetical protein [Candidatus Neomarinimicrobiota bacterium]
MKNFLMSVLVVAIFVALIGMYWYQTTFDTRITEMNSRAGEIEANYETFTNQLHVLEMKFIGRAKHVKTNKNNIAKLNENLDNFKEKHAEDVFTINTKIDSLGTIVDANNNSVMSKIESIQKTIQNLKTTVNQNNITSTTQIKKLQRTLTSIEKRLDKVELLTNDDKKKKKGLF